MKFDWMTFTLEIVNFLVLLWILKRFLYQPVLATIARRKAAIEQNIAEAKTKQAEAQTLEHEYRGRLSAWEQEKRALREAAAEEISAERARRMAALEADLDGEREKRRVLDERQMGEWHDRAVNEAVAQGARFATKLLARLAGPDLEARIVPAALEDLARLPKTQLETIEAACRDAGNRVKVTTAFALSEKQRSAVVQGIAAAAKDSPSAEFAEDPRLLAGIRISIGPWIMRANLQDELRFFAEAARHAA